MSSGSVAAFRSLSYVHVAYPTRSLVSSPSLHLVEPIDNPVIEAAETAAPLRPTGDLPPQSPWNYRVGIRNRANRRPPRLPP